MLHRDSAASHLHSVAFEDNHLVRTTGFDYESVSRNLDGEEPPERMISMADASAAISILLGAICDRRKTGHPVNLASVGARAESLLWILDNNQSRYDSLADIARTANMTRAGLSKWLLKLKDEVGLFLSAGKMGGSRQTYAKAQRAAIAAGCHSSNRRRSRAAKPE
jgi:hypothetical protein